MTEENTQEESQESVPYKAHSDEDIKQLAMDIHAGRVMTSQHVPESENIRLVFMAAALSGPEYGKWLLENDVVVFYEYMDKAAPMSINGLPQFLSHKHLDRSDWERVLEKLSKIEKAMEDL